MIVELECISQYPLPEVSNGYTTSRIPIRVFQKKLFIIESLDIEEHINSKGIRCSKYTTGKYDSEYYKFNIPYQKIKQDYFTPIVIKGLGK